MFPNEIDPLDIGIRYQWGRFQISRVVVGIQIIPSEGKQRNVIFYNSLHDQWTFTNTFDRDVPDWIPLCFVSRIVIDVEKYLFFPPWLDRLLETFGFYKSYEESIRMMIWVKDHVPAWDMSLFDCTIDT